MRKNPQYFLGILEIFESKKKIIFGKFRVLRRKSDILNTEFIPPQYIKKKYKPPLKIYIHERKITIFFLEFFTNILYIYNIYTYIYNIII